MTGMETLDFLFVMAVLVAVVYCVNRWISVKDNANRYKAQKDSQIAQQNRKAAQIRGEQYAEKRRGKTPVETLADVVEVGKWVYDLAETFGWDPELLFQDEMPDDVARILPAAKGFIESGALQRLLGSGKTPGESTPPEMSGGPGW